MCHIFLEVQCELLINVLFLVFILEKDIAFRRYTSDLQVLQLLFSWLFILFIFFGLLLELFWIVDFDYLQDEYFIWLNLSVYEHLEVDEELTTLLLVLLLHQIGGNVDEASELVGPNLGLVSLMG
jgi:hypothetical protein